MTRTGLYIALVDMDEDARGCNNKDQAGTYGAVTHADGLAGRAFRLLKRHNVRLPILSFAHLASILRAAGHTVSIHDGAPERADLVVIATSIVGHPQEIALARRIRQRLPAARIGFVGAFSRARPELFLDAGDFVVDGEPEAWALAADDLRGSAGVVRAGLVADLDALPFPDWTGFPLDRYCYRPLLHRRSFVTVLSSRGCPFACPYCPYLPVQGTRFRNRSAESVAAELNYLACGFGVRSVLFRDINFSTDKERIAAIAEAILSRGLDIDWVCETRADCLDADLIELMKRAGLRAVNLGVESPDDELLKANGRPPYDRGQLERIVGYCESNGVRISAFFMVGFTDDTERSVRRMIDYACELNPSFAQFSVVTPYPGTPYYDQVRDEGRLLDLDWSEYTTYDPVMRLDHLGADDVRRLRDLAYRRFYLRPRWMRERGRKLAAMALRDRLRG